MRQKLAKFLTLPLKLDLNYFIKNSIWWTVGEFLVSLLSFLTLVIFGYTIPQKTYGTYQYVISIVSLVAISCLPGMRKAVVSMVAKKQESFIFPASKEVGKWSLLGISALLLISSWYFFHQNYILAVSFFIAALFFWPIRIFNLAFDFWQGKELFHFERKNYVLINLGEAVIFIPVLFLTNNLLVILLAYFLSRNLFRGIFYFYTLRHVSTLTSQFKKIFKKPLSFGKHLTFLNLLDSIANQIDKIMMWHFGGSLTTAVYSFAQMPAQKIQELIPIAPLLLPRLSKISLQNNKKKLLKVFLLLMLLIIPITVLVIKLAPFFYKVFFPKYNSALPYFQILSLGLLFVPFSLFHTALFAKMDSKSLFYISLAKNLSKILLFFALVPIYKIWGGVISILIARFIESFLVAFFFFKTNRSIFRNSSE